MDIFSEDDIRPDKIIDAMNDYPGMDQIFFKLLAQKENFVSVRCPACDVGGSVFEYNIHDMAFVRCNNCGTVYQSPRPTLKMLQEYYCDDNPLYKFWNDCVFNEVEEKRRDVIVRPRVDYLFEQINKARIGCHTFMDIGAGYGTLCVEVASRNIFERVIALEPTAKLAETCRSRGLEVIEKTVEELGIGEVSADVITSFEVIEHLFSPHEFLLFCRKCLSEPGLLMLSCPNMEGFDLMLLKDKSVTVGGEHINLFTPKGMRSLLHRSGFDVLQITTPGKLDAELVRKSVLKKEFDISGNPFLHHVLIENWEKYGAAFQNFLADAGLSSHMVVVARKGQFNE